MSGQPATPHANPKSAAPDPRPGLTDDGLRALAVAAVLHGCPADAADLRRRLGLGTEPASLLDLVAGAQLLGLEAREAPARWEALRRQPVPIVARRHDGSHLILARLRDADALVQDAVGGAPQVVGRAAIEPMLAAALVLRPHAERSGIGERFGLAWFGARLWTYRGVLRDVLVASFFLQIFALLTPLAFQVVIDKVIAHRGLSTLEVLAIGLLIVTLFESLLGAVRGYLLAHTAMRLDVEFGAKLLRRLLDLPLGYFASRRTGDVAARLKELEIVRGFLTGSSVTLLIDLPFMLVFLSFMAVLSPLLTLVVVATLPAYAVIAGVAAPALRRRLNDRFAQTAETQSRLVELIGGIETLKSMALEPVAQRRLDRDLAATAESQFAAGRAAQAVGAATGLVNKLATVALLWLGAWLVIDGDLTVGQLVAFNMLSGRVVQPILRLTQLVQEHQQVRVALARLADIATAAPETAPARRSTPSTMQGRIEFADVGFRYQADGPEVLSGISFSVEPGQVIGIVGPSGSGKSTLVKLLQRLYLPTAGRIAIDGFNLADMDRHWVRRHMGVVQQDTVLFHGTVRENIALADPALPLDAVIAVARIAGIHDAVQRLPQGYDTPVGERGVTLSGGERQRIAIARALANDPRILILDEATSALDYETEAAIQRNMRQICAGRTVIVVAHRLSTVRFADRILLLDGGRLVEQGRHEDLVAGGGRYARLHGLHVGAADVA